MLSKLIDLLLYSNIFIAACAASLVYQVYWIEDSPGWYNPLAWLVFFATVFVYSAHRLVGFTRLERGYGNRRISVILQFKSHIAGYTLVALAGLFFSCTLVLTSSLLLMMIPGIITLLYIVPVFRHRRRFRDLPYIKVFIVGMVWSWTCIYIPLQELHSNLEVSHYLLIVEKFLFITAITIPFDIRDRELDTLQHIKTIPVVLGIGRSKLICMTLVSLAIIVAGINWHRQYFDGGQFVSLLLAYLSAIMIIYIIHEKSHDYYYSGMLDGTIVLQCVLMLLFS
jgi:4-hydroxybenzoate polyprenyltransferase